MPSRPDCASSSRPTSRSFQTAEAGRCNDATAGAIPVRGSSFLTDAHTADEAKAGKRSEAGGYGRSYSKRAPYLRMGGERLTSARRSFYTGGR